MYLDWFRHDFLYVCNSKCLSYMFIWEIITFNLPNGLNSNLLPSKSRSRSRSTRLIYPNGLNSNLRPSKSRSRSRSTTSPNTYRWMFLWRTSMVVVNHSTYTRTHGHTQTHKHTDTQTHKHTDTQTHKHTDTQTHKHTNTHTHTHMDIHTPTIAIFQNATRCISPKSASKELKTRGTILFRKAGLISDGLVRANVQQTIGKRWLILRRGHVVINDLHGSQRRQIAVK